MTAEEVREVLNHFYGDQEFDDRTIQILLKLIEAQPLMAYNFKLAKALTSEGPNPQQRQLFATYLEEAIRTARRLR